MTNLKSYIIQITGIVQGVGMRPCIFNIANKHNLEGWVSNLGAAVNMKITGNQKDIHDFLSELQLSPPIGAEISKINIKSASLEEFNGFSIRNSLIDNQQQGIIPPDTTICKECLIEIQDRKNRRYLYPFTNCTSCGPRYSIIKSLPYDRENTSMSTFEMCSECKKEYENPENRRFHAQTNCCPNCGPSLSLFDNKRRRIVSDNPIATTRQLLYDGRIIGIKGIGGYHLACNAQDEDAVDLLRKRKIRPDKPLAIMAANLEAAKLISYISEKEEIVLTGRQKPIVLLDKQDSKILPDNIAPGVNRIGVMLPYTPLHCILFYEQLQFLVMTSGNISSMPICYKDEVAFDKLKDIADYFLIHDREIITSIDDSVVRVVDGNEMICRNARGYSPYAVKIDSDTELLAAGAEQKSSLCLIHKGYAHVTQYLGNLEDMSGYEGYLQAAKRMKELLGTEPQIIVHDLHMGYLSTQWAIKQSATKIPIQHHHAHMAACMEEHNLKGDAIGIIYDGTGLGTDGAIWGGEFFVGSIGKYSRVGHWKYVNLQGGDSAIREPWKSAVSYLYAMEIDCGEIFNNNVNIKAFQNAIKHNVNCFKSSSIGRLFDCVAALVLKRKYITYDAQAAIELESVIEKDISDVYPYSIDDKEENFLIGYEDIILGILRDMKDGKLASYISAKFHNTICEATIDCVRAVRYRFDINDIVLGGGVFENVYLLKNIIHGLKRHNFNIYHNRKAPINDGGISLGQAAIAAHIAKEGLYVSGSTG